MKPYDWHLEEFLVAILNVCKNYDKALAVKDNKLVIVKFNKEHAATLLGAKDETKD